MIRFLSALMSVFLPTRYIRGLAPVGMSSEILTRIAWKSYFLCATDHSPFSTIPVIVRFFFQSFRKRKYIFNSQKIDLEKTHEHSGSHWKWPVLAGPGRSWPVLAGPGRSWPVLAGPRINKVLKLFQKIFFFNFGAKHTKGLKPFRAHSGYRNLLGVRGSSFTEEKVWWTGQDRPRSARTGHFQCPRTFQDRKMLFHHIRWFTR